MNNIMIVIEQYNFFFLFLLFNNSQFTWCWLVANRVPQTWVFGIWRYHGVMGIRKLEQGFSSFCVIIFLAYLRIFHRWACRRCWKTLKNHQIWQKFGKNLVRLAFDPFLHGTLVIRVPVPPLMFIAYIAFASDHSAAKVITNQTWMILFTAYINSK